ncbi:GDP-Man:Man(3)GlcNAc(2)-PP-Dol alpha-1,2-mannosyltransferase-like [Bradysia coprophila]|uniref:GDP-Man:Man(3)GlcNAc(2)-PP-Dol alpha-1,2-mannosyltransferase-like n=1 Tax=Bradysia coprophila TaxID=38358 RepID=UPI00187DB091|nr:GDP-Man:Man(3)GlcNAc(2)-PP-Dol alpha-1,2-mannosyltransferase-like [Bradysia coprophila]
MFPILRGICFSMIPILREIVNYFITLLLLCTGLVALIAILSVFALRKYVLNKKRMSGGQEHIIRIGIFHPYCNTGAGVERVMWCAIRALQFKYGSKIHIRVYTGDTNVNSQQILRNAERMFNILVDEKNVDFVFLKQRYLVEEHRDPFFNLLGQCLGSMVLGMEALLRYQPDVFIDTMGYAFTYPIFRYIGGCRVGCYTHYPVISTNMLKLEHQSWFAWMKLFYYRMFAKIYGCVGRSAHTVMVISSWTEKYITDLWNVRTHRVYPPGDVASLKKLKHIDSDQIVIISVGQFRPEKDHPLQLQAMCELRTKLQNNQPLWEKVKLVIIGSCRDKDDEERKRYLEDLTKQLSLDQSVEIKANVSYGDIMQHFRVASIGLNTMCNEHFGIGVVDMLAAGLITVANRSGGPMMDIIETSEDSRTGYLAVGAIDYANCIEKILYSTKEENETIRNAARASCDRFTEEEFQSNFLRAVTPLFDE